MGHPACPLLSLALATTFARGQVLPVVEPEEPLAVIAAAEKRVTGKPDEDLVLELWQTERLLLETPDTAARAAAQQTLQALLAKADPNEGARRETYAAVARFQVELAAAYRARKWFEVAEDRLRAAAHYDSGPGQKEQQLLAAARTAVPAGQAAAKGTPGPKPLLDASNLWAATGDWKLADGVLQSPAKEQSQNRVWISKLSHADHEVSCEMDFGGADGSAALMLGAQTDRTTDSYVVTLFQHTRERRLNIEVQRCTDVATDVADRDTAMAEAKDGFHRLSVCVRGDLLAIAVDGKPVLECRCATGVKGRVGLTVSPKTPGSGVVRFRNLRIDPLPGKQDDAAAKEEQRKGVLEAVARAEALLKQKQPEAASQVLRAVQERLRLLDPGALRDSLAASLEKLLLQADGLHGKRKKAMADCASSLAALAELYGKAGQVRTALQQWQEAAKFDPDGLAARVQAAAAAAEQWQVTQAREHAAELAPPAGDGTLLHDWFAYGDNLVDAQAWQLDGPVARVVGMEPDRLTTWMPAKVQAPVRKVAVSVQLPVADTFAGLCFEVKSMNAYDVCVLRRRAQDLELSICRWTLERWNLLARTTIRVPAWRMQGWFELQLETSPGGVMARAMGASVEVERGDLGAPGGRIGLCAGNESKERPTIELRGFRLPE